MCLPQTLPFLLWWILLFLIILAGWPVENLDHYTEGLPMFFAFLALVFLLGGAASREERKAEQDYLNSLPPEERERAIEARMRTFIEFQRREEQRRLHEEQLRRDLDIIDRHYRRK